MVLGSSPVAVTSPSDFTPASSKEFLDIKATIRVWIHSETCMWHDKNKQSKHRTDKYSEHSSIIWPVWPNGWVLVYELSGSRFESSCSHLNFRLRACFEQGVLWYLGNYRVWIHSEASKWHDKNIQSRYFVRKGTQTIITFSNDVSRCYKFA